MERIDCDVLKAWPMYCTVMFPAAFNLEFYTEVQDLQYLVRSMGNTAFSKRYRYEHTCPVLLALSNQHAHTDSVWMDPSKVIDWICLATQEIKFCNMWRRPRLRSCQLRAFGNTGEIRTDFHASLSLIMKNASISGTSPFIITFLC